MAVRDTQPIHLGFRNLSERSESLCPSRMLGSHLFDDLWMLCSEVRLLLRVFLQVEQLPRVFVVLLIESPVLPPDSDQVTALSISWAVSTDMFVVP